MRACGDCQLCCKLLPVRSLGKAAGERCQHQRHHKGCSVYARLHLVSPECKLWSCRWLVGDDTADQARPDRSHCVIDLMPDFVTVRNNDTGELQQIQVVQIWIDPKHPEAIRDPALRAYMLRRGAEGIASLCRFDERRATTVFPPNMSADDDEWHEFENGELRDTHTLADMAAAGFGKIKIEIGP